MANSLYGISGLGSGPHPTRATKSRLAVTQSRLVWSLYFRSEVLISPLGYAHGDLTFGALSTKGSGAASPLAWSLRGPTSMHGASMILEGFLYSPEACRVLASISPPARRVCGDSAMVSPLARSVRGDGRLWSLHLPKRVWRRGPRTRMSTTRAMSPEAADSRFQS